MAEEESMVAVGLGTVLTGGFLTALAEIADVSFGLLPVGFFGLGSILIGLGLAERLIPLLRKK